MATTRPALTMLACLTSLRWILAWINATKRATVKFLLRVSQYHFRDLARINRLCKARPISLTVGESKRPPNAKVWESLTRIRLCPQEEESTSTEASCRELR